MDGTCEILDKSSLLFKKGSIISASGSNALNAQTITFVENTSLALPLGEINKGDALICLSTSNISFTTGTIDFVGVDTLSEGKYMVFSLTEPQLTSMNWDTD